MPLFKRRQPDDSPEHERAIADLARHAGVSVEEARRSAGDMSVTDIAEFIALEEQAAAEQGDPPSPHE